MATLCTIYALSDPRLERVFENVRYVGKTILTLSARLRGHISVKDSCYKRSWISSLEAQGVLPVIWPLAFCNSQNWQRVETEWIARLKPVSKLTNLTDGGDGNNGRKWTAEQKRASSERRLKNPMVFTAEHRRKISLANKGKKKPPFTESQIEKMRLAKLGSTHSQEHRDKMSAIMKGRLHTWGSKISETHKARGIKPVMTPEIRKKIAAANTGQKRTAEFREKIRIANSRAVVCLQTGEKFLGAKSTGVNNVTRAIKTGQMAGGFNWQYANNPA